MYAYLCEGYFPTCHMQNHTNKLSDLFRNRIYAILVTLGLHTTKSVKTITAK